jgi:hypothetical protein
MDCSALELFERSTTSGVHALLFSRFFLVHIVVD